MYQKETFGKYHFKEASAEIISIPPEPVFQCLDESRIFVIFEFQAYRYIHVN
jgi:hypothetical protein